MLAAVPSLRAFAMSLVGNTDRADNLVFEIGTNLNGWLFTILRKLFHSEYRKRRREVEDADGSDADRLSAPPEQGARLDFEDFRKAWRTSPMISMRPYFWLGLRAVIRGGCSGVRSGRGHRQEPGQPGTEQARPDPRR